VIAWIDEACAHGAPRHKACEVLGLTLRGVQRRQQEGEVREDGRKATARLRTPAHTLSSAERERVLEVANRAQFADLSPKQIVPRLADQGEYVASESSFDRILREAKQLAHRGKAKPPTRRRPEPRVAIGPHQVWTWDMTYLPTHVRGAFFYLYRILDLFSRKLVGWEVPVRASADLAAALFRQSYLREGVEGDTLALHSDNGAPMKGATMLATLQRLRVMPSFSRPSVSNDTPFSEALFRTLKYTPAFPGGPFASLDDARAWVARFVPWYSSVHLHSSLPFVTPEQRPRGEDQERLRHRIEVYEAAKARNPARGSGDIRNWEPVGPVSLNPGKPAGKDGRTQTS